MGNQRVKQKPLSSLCNPVTGGPVWHSVGTFGDIKGPSISLKKSGKKLRFYLVPVGKRRHICTLKKGKELGWRLLPYKTCHGYF